VRLWDVHSGVAVAVLRAHTDVVTCVSEGFTDGEGRWFVASGSNDMTVRVWNVDTLECSRTLSGHDHGVVAVSGGIVDANGRRLLAAASGRRVLLWDILAEPPVVVRALGGTGTGPDSELDACACTCVTAAFTDGGDRVCVATASKSGTVRVWDVTSGKSVSVVTANESMGFRSVEAVACVSVLDSGTGSPGSRSRCRLAIGVGSHAVVVEEPDSRYPVAGTARRDAQPLSEGSQCRADD
jgi:WD40 repeat protein